MELTIHNVEGKLLVDSRDVAEMIDKRHDHLLRDIKRYIEVLGQANDMYIESHYLNKQNKSQPCYLLSKKGCETYARKMIGEKHLRMLELITEVFGSENSLSVYLPERKEISFLNKLEDALKPFSLKLIKQKVVCGKYRIDAVIESLNIAIEYDEYEHRYKLEDDILRQKEIEEYLGYDFIRLKEDMSDEYNIGLTLKYIVEKLNRKVIQ